MGVEQSLEGVMQSNCRIVIIAPRNGEDCLSVLGTLPSSARILAIGNNLEELQAGEGFFSEGNVLLNITGNSKVLGEIICQMPFLVWVHSLSAGVDHMMCPELENNEDITLTNAKGVFSSSLGEYVMGACSYFAKNIPRLNNQKKEHKWEKFCVKELKGQTMGIVGYGSIGHACARLAKAYGMNVIGLRKNPSLSDNDRSVDKMYGIGELDEVIRQSDYLVVCLAFTKETKHFIKLQNLRCAKKDMIFINIGRGALVDEEHLIEALEDGTIAGAALDVFTTEPLPESSKIWDLPNVLLSPHNADMLWNFKHSSMELFVHNCNKFINGEDLQCIVDKTAGY